MSLLSAFKEYIRKEHLFESRDRLLLAVSGGVDSVALCALCRQAGYEFEIAHCNFQLRGDDSNRDEDFVRALALQYGVQFHSKVFDTIVDAAAAKKSIEETARELRYEWFNSLLATSRQREASHAVEKTINQSPVYVLTAHHADDNVETVLMNFFRGTGITGLRGILPIQGRIVRPLLFARRSQLERYVKDNKLPFVTDHTNLENDFTRNYFRNTIIPLVNESYPEATNNVLKNIARFREAAILYGQSIDLHKKKLLEVKGAEIHVPVLKLLKTIPLSTVLYEIIRPYGFTAHQVNEVESLLKSDTGKYIQSSSHRIIKNRNWIIISPWQTTLAENILIESADTMIHFDGGSLFIGRTPKENFRIDTDPVVAHVDLSTITFPLLLRRWKQGDYFYPLGMQKKKKLSRFFIDQKLSLIQKENCWVIEMDKKIIWIVGMRLDDRFKITDCTTQICSFRLLTSSGN